MAGELSTIRLSAGMSSPTARDLAAVLFRQRRILLITFAVVLLAVLVYGLMAPSYEAHMKILVRKGRLDPVVTPAPSEPLQTTTPEISEQELNSEMELLHGREVLQTVVAQSGLFDPSWSSNSERDTKDEVSLARSVRRLARHLNVQTVRKTAMIAVTYSSSDPTQAERVLQCLADAYLEKHRQLQRPRGELDFFDRQVAESAHALKQAEEKLASFSRGEGVVSAAAERDLSLQRLADAEASSLQTRVATAETQERIRALHVRVHALPQTITSSVRVADNPELLQKLKSTLLDLELKRTELRTSFRPSYRLVQELDEQIRQTEAAIAGERLTPIHDTTTAPNPDYQWGEGELIKAQVELEVLAARSAASDHVVNSYREAAFRLGNEAVTQEQLIRNMKAAEDKYLLYENKREEARIGDALDAGGILNVAIAEAPIVPSLPVHSYLHWAMLGMACAVVAGTGAAFASDYLDPRFRNVQEVAAYLGAPVLASLPSQKRLPA